MKIIIENPSDYIYYEELKEITAKTGDPITEALKTAIALYHKDWVDKGLI